MVKVFPFALVYADEVRRRLRTVEARLEQREWDLERALAEGAEQGAAKDRPRDGRLPPKPLGVILAAKSKS
jgi:hypothetical protein